MPLSANGAYQREGILRVKVDIDICISEGYAFEQFYSGHGDQVRTSSSRAFKFSFIQNKYNQ